MVRVIISPFFCASNGAVVKKHCRADDARRTGTTPARAAQEWIAFFLQEAAASCKKKQVPAEKLFRRNAGAPRASRETKYYFPLIRLSVSQSLRS